MDIVPALTRISPETEIRDVDGIQCVFYEEEYITPLGRKKGLEDIWCFPEPGYTIGRCKMIKRNGDRCRNAVRMGWTVCHYHGAGRPGAPGGLSNIQVSAGRHSQRLPTNIVEQYQTYISDPDALNMSSELALIDVRVGELLERLEDADTQAAWMNVSMAYRRLDKQIITDEDIDNALELLEEALDGQRSNTELWEDILKMVEARRRLAESERRRIVEAKQVMTIQEANIFMSYLLNSVMTHVSNSKERRAIADDLRRFT